MEFEVALPGGIANRGLVVRVGDTVHRPQRKTSAATHALLQHLADVNFDGAPRFIGIDSQGREVLSYIPGTAITPPYPDWAMTEAALRSVAQLLRRYHDAVLGFDPIPFIWPQSAPAPFAGKLISHNDPNLDNVVFRNGRAVAFIDFDLASPGSRLWDVAAAGRLWAPLRSEIDISDVRRGQSFKRFAQFVDAYSLPNLDSQQLVRAAQLSHDWIYSIVQSGAEQGILGYADYWRDGGAERARRTQEWYRENEHHILEALHNAG